jgi:hypothetical protein
MVGRWFADLFDEMIRRGVFHCVDDVIAAVTCVNPKLR